MGRKVYEVDLRVEERASCKPGKSTGAPAESCCCRACANEEARPSSAPASKPKGCKHQRKPIHDEDGSSSSDESDATDEVCQLHSMEADWRYPMYSPSASYRQVDVVSGSHQYTISGFPLARSMGAGTRLCSDFFEVCGQLFRLEVYPGGFTADTRRFVSVFLTTPGAVNPNHVMYEVAILDQSGKDRHIVERRGSYSHQTFSGGLFPFNGPLLCCSRGIVAAVPKFIKAKFLKEHCMRYMPSGMLVLRATVQVLRGWSSAPMVHGHLACPGGANAAGLGMGMGGASLLPQLGGGGMMGLGGGYPNLYAGPGMGMGMGMGLGVGMGAPPFAPMQPQYPLAQPASGYYAGQPAASAQQPVGGYVDVQGVPQSQQQLQSPPTTYSYQQQPTGQQFSGASGSGGYAVTTYSAQAPTAGASQQRFSLPPQQQQQQQSPGRAMAAAAPGGGSPGGAGPTPFRPATMMQPEPRYLVYMSSPSPNS